jgi:tetratricopeptide (TPR) repeat protein
MKRAALAMGLSLILGAGGAVCILAADSIPARPGVGGGPKKVDPKTIEALLKQGREALAAGEYKAASDAFHDAAAADPKNVEALHGEGLARMYQNDFVHSLGPMEKALIANPAPNRALVLNMAVCQIGQPGSKNAMRAATIIMDYLTAHPATLDEPLLNAMATAMYVADDQAKKGSKFAQCESFYKNYNQKLEAAKPGMKRWGVQWMSASTVDSRVAANAAVDKQLASLNRDMDALDGKIGSASAELDKAKDLFRRGFIYEYKLTEYVQALKVLTDSMEEKQKEYDQVAAKYQRPTFPKAMTLVAMDDLTPPPVAANVAIVEDTAAIQKTFTTTKVRANAKPKVDPVKPKTDGPKTELKVEEPLISIQAKPVVRTKIRINSYAAAFPISDTLVLTAAGPLAGATEIELQTADGSPIKAELVRTDEAAGLALLRVSGKKLIPLILANSFTGGAIQCAAYPTVNIFNPLAEPIPGTAKAPVGEWKVTLSRHPRLGGSPLLAANKVIGVELASRETDPNQIPSATLETIKKFLGPDMPSTPAGTPEPCSVLLQLMATRESSGG